MEHVLTDLHEARERTLHTVAGLGDEALTRSPDPIMSPLVWDLGHIAAFEDLWLVHRHGERPLLHPELMGAYDAAETPRAVRSEIDILDVRAAWAYLHDVRARALEVLAQRGPGEVHDLVIAHEHQHNETMLQTIALMSRDKGTTIAPVPAAPRPGPRFIPIAAGPFQMGAPPDRFAYDNERPRHEVNVDAFEIADAPVSGAQWLRFIEDGGYERRELWSKEGWTLVREQGMHARPADDERPVMHVSAYEADAFARAHDARLPTETEWEKAATWEGFAADEVRPSMFGEVWEWTASEFSPYPGFHAHPYPEYSEVFFRQGGYRVLRGGSWATWGRLATPTFRNWDLPRRRQIFAGLRLAR